MENIFENAKFGDKFLCVNDEIALYLNINDCLYRLVTEHGHVFDCDNEGYCKTYGMETYGVLSRYQDPIDEEKLDELAHNYCDEVFFRSHGINYANPIDAYKVGYRKAMEE